MLKNLTKTAMFVVLAACTAVASAQPASFIDLGVIGTDADTFLFHTEGSLPNPVGTAVGQDTELGLWDAAGVLINANDDGGALLPGAGNGFESAIETTLAAGEYYLGVSIFNSTFADGFINTLAPFGAGESVTAVLDANGIVGNILIGGDAPLDQTGFFRVEVTNAVPEPASATLLAVIGLAVAGRRRR